MQRTELSCPTVIESLSRLEEPWPCRFNHSPARQSQNLLRLRPSSRLKVATWIARPSSASLGFCVSTTLPVTDYHDLQLVFLPRRA